MWRGQERPFGRPKALPNALKNGTNFNQLGTQYCLPQRIYLHPRVYLEKMEKTNTDNLCTNWKANRFVTQVVKSVASCFGCGIMTQLILKGSVGLNHCMEFWAKGNRLHRCCCRYPFMLVYATYYKG